MICCQHNAWIHAIASVAVIAAGCFYPLIAVGPEVVYDIYLFRNFSARFFLD